MKLSAQEKDFLRNIDGIRGQLSSCHKKLVVQDYGAGERFFLSFVGKKSVKEEGRTVASIYSSSAIPKHWGIFLFRLVRELKPLNVLELGTNLGVSASYIQTALDLNANGGRLVTIEGDPVLASIARESISKISKSDVEIIVGRFHDVLPALLSRVSSLDLVFIDGHHEEKAMIDYYNIIQPHLSAQACVVFDDIYLWNISLRHGWNKIRTEDHKSISYDFAKLGIVFPNGFAEK